MLIVPLKDRLLVRECPQEEKTKSGIYLADQAKKKQQTGIVKAVGSKCLNVKQGDKVLYGHYAGSIVSMDNEQFLLIKEEDVFAVLS